MKSLVLRALSLILLASMIVPKLNAQITTLASVFAPVPFLPNSTIIPIPGSTINYTHVMFDHPPVDKAVLYGFYLTEQSDKGISTEWKLTDSTTSTLMNVLKFGKSYQWHYTALNARNKVIFTSPDYKFSIVALPANSRVRVVTNEKDKNQGGYISFDYHCMIADRNGNPIWILPEEPKKEYTRDDRVRDIRVTSAGTITFITNRNAFEVMPDGRISWRGPKSGPATVEALHHGVERLPNGNLMTLGNHTVRMPVPFDTAIVPVEFGVVVEYDRKGSIVWKWDSYSYLRPAEIEFRKLSSGQWNSSSHMNAFRQTTENGIVYVYAGFRDLDRLVKIEKSSSKVVGTYGTQMNSGYGWKYNNLFHAQHDVCPLRDGNIAVFNNDSLTRDGVISSLVIFNPVNSALVFRMTCEAKGETDGKSEKCGGVDELPNGNLLVNCGNVNRTFELDANHKVVWDAYTEYAPSDTSGWKPAGQYRSHYCASLYPVWFTTNIVNTTKKMVTMKIWNEGDNADKYTIQYMVGKSWITLSSVEVQPYKSTTAMIPRVKGVVFSKIKVISEANPDFFRTLDVVE